MAAARRRGEGTIRTRTYERADGSAYTRHFAVVSITMPGGGRRRITGPSRADIDDARRDLTRLAGARDDQTLSTSSDTVATYLHAWLADREPDIRPRTLTTYRSDIERHLVPRIGRVRLRDLSPGHVHRLMTGLRRDASDAVARKARAVLRTALQDAVRLEVIGRNPAAVVPAPRPSRRTGPGWSTAQAQAFVDTCSGAGRLGKLYLLILATGLRAGEALGLTWGHVMPDAIEVRQAIRTVGAPIFVPPKTKRGVRTIHIASDTADLLAAASEDVAALRERARTWDDHDLVFPAANGRPLRLENVRRHYNRTLATADQLMLARTGGQVGLPRARLHDLRHYHLTRLVALGVDVDTVSRRAGHSRTSTTLDLYVHGDESAARRSALSLTRLLTDDEPA